MSSEHYDDKEQASGDDEDEADNDLDPRVKGQLDRLNSSTAEINRLEKELEEVQETFRQTLAESAIVLKNEASFLGQKCIEQARPYYNATQKAKETQMETQRVALKYERACHIHQSAKEVLARAENKFVSTAMVHKILDSSWQEVLNQAILKVMESEEEKRKSEKEHLDVAHAFMKAGKHVTELKMNLKSAISKSRSYFELKDKYMEALEMHKHCVEVLQQNIQKAKKEYSLALKSLEEISDEIHEMRKSRDNLDALLNKREEGVGAEAPALDSPRDITRDDEYCKMKGVFGFKVAIIRTKYPPKISARKEVDEGGGKIFPCSDMSGASQDVQGAEPVMVQETDDTVYGDSLEIEVCKQEMGGGLSNTSQAGLGMAGGAPEVGEVRGEVEGACLDVEEASQAVEEDKQMVKGTVEKVDGARLEVGETGVMLERVSPEVEEAMLEVVGATSKVGGASGEMDGTCHKMDGTKLEVDGARLEVGEAGVMLERVSPEVEVAMLEVDEATSMVGGASGEMGGTIKQEVDGARLEVGETGVILERVSPEVDVTMLEVDGATLKVGGAMGEMDGTCQDVDGAGQDVGQVEHEFDTATIEARRRMEDASQEVVAAISAEVINAEGEMEGASQKMTGPSLEMVDADPSKVKGAEETVTVVSEGTEKDDLD